MRMHVRNQLFKLATLLVEVPAEYDGPDPAEQERGEEELGDSVPKCPTAAAGVGIRHRMRA